ncbi:MAG TPA: hypothetical protein DEB06_02560 [Phycisphaerales bacterium]|nr:hypothetical protein [Phycisphaerales bacterium]
MEGAGTELGLGAFSPGRFAPESAGEIDAGEIDRANPVKRDRMIAFAPSTSAIPRPIASSEMIRLFIGVGAPSACGGRGRVRRKIRGGLVPAPREQHEVPPRDRGR